MPARDLGAKFVCFKCSSKFYDLKKPEPICPKCGSDQRESPANKPAEKTRGRLASVPKVVEPVAEEPPAKGDDDEDEEDGDDFEEAAADDDEG